MKRAPYAFLLLAMALWSIAAAHSDAQTVNVTNYGAIGDAVQCTVSTTSNSVLVTTANTLSSLDIGKTIEIFGVGNQTYGLNSYGSSNGNQDFVGIITNVTPPHNLYVQPLVNLIETNPIPQVTTNGTFATYGTDNTGAFSNSVAACAGFSTATIIIPSGTYLLMPVLAGNYGGYSYASQVLFRGGLNFVGQSNPVLLSRGAWFIAPVGATTYTFRGFLFEVTSPITNDLPLTFKGLTMDGGVQNGSLIIHGVAVNPVDGLGWDQQHSAYLLYDSTGTRSGTVTHQAFTNVIVQHWRGEMFKSIDENTNGNLALNGCAFIDGDATALNIYPSWDVRSCLFSNLFQVMEYYQAYYTNVAYFCNNLITNNDAGLGQGFAGNGIAINGASTTTPPFIIQSNQLYWPNGFGYDTIVFTPAANVSVLNNQLYLSDYSSVFVVGSQGSQGNVENSNILISQNYIYSTNKIASLYSLGGPGITAVNGLTMSSNYVMTGGGCVSYIYGNIASSNLSFMWNTNADSLAGSIITGYSDPGDTPFMLIQSNNQYYPNPWFQPTVITNLISYASGPKQVLDFVATSNLFMLQDTNAYQIPAGAYLFIDNRTNRWSQNGYGQSDLSGNVYIQTSQSSTNSILLTNGAAVTYWWNTQATQWQTNVPSSTALIGTQVQNIVVHNCIIQ